MATRRKNPLEPRKQPAQERAAATVAVILETAAHILETAGFAAYSTNAIARRAGVSIGSLYQYFPGKDAITIALIQQEGATLLAAVEAAATLDDWQESLRAMIAAAASHQLTRPVLARMLDVEEARLQASSVKSQIPALLRAILQRGLGKDRHLDIYVTDIIALTRGITDMAAEQGQFDMDDLKLRLDWAIFGYLEQATGKGRAG